MFLAAGAHLDKYEIVTPLAVGGMAELYLARTRGTAGFERLCVVKRILPQHARDAQFVSMFLDEARLAAMLNHPNVIDVYDVGVEAGRYYFVMEYVHGQDLGALIAATRTNRRGLKVSVSVGICIAAAAGLHHAHTQTGPDGTPLRIVHRDVSPANILISYDGHVKVVDFGIAKAAARATQTTAGGMKGKLCYMSPEQVVASADLDHRSDVFSLGVVLYELTTGQALFRGESDFLIATRITEGDIPRPSVKRPGYDAHLESIVMKALAMDPAERWPSAQAFQHALEDYARSAQLDTSSRALGELMRSLFADRIDTWERDQRDLRRSLDRPLSVSDEIEMTVEVAPPTSVTVPELKRPRRPRWPLVAGAAVLVLGGAGTAAVFATRGDEAAVTAPPEATVAPPMEPATAPPPIAREEPRGSIPVVVPLTVVAPPPPPPSNVPRPAQRKPPRRPSGTTTTGSEPRGSGSAALDDVVDPFAK